jgi:hypothetical protein
MGRNRVRGVRGGRPDAFRGGGRPDGPAGGRKRFGDDPRADDPGKDDSTADARDGNDPRRDAPAGRCGPRVVARGTIRLLDGLRGDGLRAAGLQVAENRPVAGTANGWVQNAADCQAPVGVWFWKRFPESGMPVFE